MTITDKRALKIIKSIKCYEARESIESYPEEERDGKTDLEIILSELEYFVYMFEEVDGSYKGDLDESREILRKTHNGKTIPISLTTFKPIYSEWRIKSAKNTVSEYRQLKRLVTKIRDLQLDEEIPVINESELVSYGVDVEEIKRLRKLFKEYKEV